MLTLKQIEGIAEAILDLYQRIESDLLLNVAARFSVLNGAPLSGMAAWQAEKLNELGALRAENIELLAKYSGLTEKAIVKTLTEAGYKAVEYDEGIYAKAYEKGLLPNAATPLRASEGVKQILNAAVGNAKNVLNLVNTTAVQSAQQAFMDIVNQAYLETSLGVRSYGDAIRTAVRALADKGITGASYIKNGKTINYQIDTAVRKMILGSVSQTAGAVQMQRADDWDSNLVEVTSHIGARSSHAEWQGQVYWRKHPEKNYRSFENCHYGEPGIGLKGDAFCQHDFYPFFEGLNEQKNKPYDIEENERAYQESQQQRGLERDIRQQKRRILTAQAIGDRPTMLTAQLKLKEKEAELSDFLAKTGRTRRADRQQVYGFGRSEASSASWAAKTTGA